MTPWLRHTELAFWSVLPGLVVVFLILLHSTAKHVVDLSGIMPLFHLCVVFYWAMYRPREVPHWFLFIAGLLADAVQGTPLGISSFLYILFLLILLSQLKHVHKEGFIIKWVFFAGLLMVMMGLQWLMMVMITSQFYPLSAPVIQWLVTVGLYPLVHVLLTYLAGMVARRRWHLQHAS